MRRQAELVDWTHRMQTARRIRRTGAITAVLYGVFLASAVLSADKLPDSALVEQTRTALEKWVETQRVISQEKQSFALARQMLTERIALAQREISSWRDKIGETRTSLTDADRKRTELIEENEKLQKASASLENAIATLEARTLTVLARLPEPIRERIKPLSQRLPTAPVQTKLSVSERFQNVVGILNEVNKFNRDITITSEVRTLPDGTSAEVAALYVGIGQGYYVSGNRKIAGIGTVLDGRWVWTVANEAAPQIAEAIAILKNEKVAAFVQLPIEVH